MNNVEMQDRVVRTMANEIVRKRMVDISKRLKDKGFGNAEIADTLGLSEGTIRTFLKES